jgi:hypothetical protein
MDEIKEKIFNIINNKGYLIGSRAWGGYAENSDHDVIINENIYEKILQGSKNRGIALGIHRTFNNYGDILHEMNNTINDKMTINGKVLNVIAFREEDMPKIIAVSRAMEELVGTEIGDRIAADKLLRIEVFQCFKQIMFPLVLDDDFPF